MITARLNTNSYQKLPSSPHELICRTFSSSQAICKTLSGVPVVLVNLCPSKEALLELCNQLSEHYNSAPFSEIDEIKVSPQTAKYRNSIRMSLEAHPAHTDGNFEEQPPQKFLLQFAQVDAGSGGLSLFWSIKQMLDMMPESYRAILSEHPVKFRHLNRDGGYKEFIGKVFFHRPNGQLGFRYATDSQVYLEPVSGKISTVQNALAWIDTYIANATPVAYQAQVGDILIIDNDAVLHGRSAMSAIYGDRRLVRRVCLECPQFYTGL